MKPLKAFDQEERKELRVNWANLGEQIRAALQTAAPSFDAMTPSRVKRIRRAAVGKSLKDFEQFFGVPARTVEGWEQGKKIASAEKILLKIIEYDPLAAKQAIWATKPKRISRFSAKISFQTQFLAKSKSK